MKSPREPAAATRLRWTCPTCNRAVAFAYCPACGESPLHPHDLTFRGLLAQMTQACTSIDGPFLRSLRCLVTQPGGLTVAFLTGRRKAYTLPLQLFFVANVLFFGMQSLTGAKIFSTPIGEHLKSDIWGSVARPMVAHRLAAQHASLEVYAPIFDRAVALNAKSLIVVMVVPFALAPAILFWRSRRPFVTHLVFSLHFYAFLLLLLCISLAAVGIDLLVGGRGLDSQRFDYVLSIAELAACTVYLYIAAGRVYGASGVARVLKVVPLTLAVAGIFLGYRFVLLPITLYSN